MPPRRELQFDLIAIYVVLRSCQKRRGGRQARMLHLNDITLRLGPRLLFDKATAALPGPCAGWLRRPQWCRKDDLVPDDLRASSRRNRGRSRLPRAIAARPCRARGAGWPAKPDRFRACRRSRARTLAGGSRRPRPIRPGSAKFKRASSIFRRMRRRRARRAFSRVSASTKRRSNARSSNFPAAGGCASRSLPCCFPARSLASRRADQLSRSRRHAVADRLSPALSGNDPGHQP